MLLCSILCSILSSIKGYRMEFQSVPPLSYLFIHQDAIPRSFTATESLDQEIRDLLRKGAIEPVLSQTKGFFSRLFLVAKKGGGGRRPVINLKPLNKFIVKKPFHMTTLKGVSQAIRPGDWSVTIDLKDAFFHIPIHKEYRRFLRFCWRNKVFQFCRLPFGLTSSPQFFTDVTRSLMEECRLRGIRVIFYLDDILILAPSRAIVIRHRDTVPEILESAGF